MTSSDQHQQQQPRKRKREELSSSQGHNYPAADVGMLSTAASSAATFSTAHDMHNGSHLHMRQMLPQHQQYHHSTLSNHHSQQNTTPPANISPQQHNASLNHNTASTQNESPTVPQILQLTSGFISAPKDKQPGGKKNKKPLPLHSLLIHWNNVPHSQLLALQQQHSMTLESGENSSTEAPRMIACLTRRKEDPNHEFKIIEYLTERPVDPTSGPLEEVSFNDLVIQHSSHNHGQALILLFRLVDANDQVVSEIPSSQFETITRRGIEKQKQKKNQVTKKQQLPVCTLTGVTPSAAPVGITTFVRIEGTKLALRAREQSCNVYFGEERATGVFMSQGLVSGRAGFSKAGDPDEDAILVTVPATHPQGNTAITITFGDGTGASNSLGFAFYNVASESGTNAFVRSLITGPQTQQNFFANSSAFAFGGMAEGMEGSLANGQGLSTAGVMGGKGYGTNTSGNGLYYANASNTSAGTPYGDPSVGSTTPYSAYNTFGAGNLSTSAPNSNTSMTNKPHNQYYSTFYTSAMPASSAQQQPTAATTSLDGLMDMFQQQQKNMKSEPNPLVFQQQQQQMQQHLQQLQHQNQSMLRPPNGVDGLVPPQLPLQPGMNGEP